MGTNTLVGTDAVKIVTAAAAALQRPRRGEGEPPRIPPLWDGHTAERILDALAEGGRGEGTKG
jgi:UDP-N-acetylglucosamine 2-epimerase (non-hydrolysing)